MRLRILIVNISLALVCAGYAIRLKAQNIPQPDEEKVRAIEQLWKSQGLGAVIRDWEQKAPGRVAIAEQFKKKYTGQLFSEMREFSRFFTDPLITITNLDPAHEWLQRKRNLYISHLDEFELSGYDSAWTGDYAAMAGGSPPPPGPPCCPNLDLEFGDFTGWGTDTGFASGLSSPVCTSAYIAHVGPFNYSPRIQVYNKKTPQEYDPLVGGTALPIVHPSGDYSAKIEDFQNGWGVSGLKKSFKVEADTPWIVYRYAVVLQDPGDHDDDDRPFFEVKILDGSVQSIECAYYKVIAKPDPDIEGFALVEGTNFYWKDWTEVMVPLESFVGQTLTIHFTVGDCALGGHLGYAYVDGDCLNDDLLVNGLCSPYQTIEAPRGFDHYHWTGEKIEGANYLNTVKVSKAGKYEVHLTTVTGCHTTKTVEIHSDCPDPVINCTLGPVTHSVSACNTSDNTYSVSGQVTVNTMTEGFLLVKAGPYSQIIDGPFSGPVNYNINGLQANGQAASIEFYLFRSRHFSPYTQTCDHVINYSAPVSCGESPIACENCIKGFEPEPNKKYVISAWVKEDGASPLVYDYNDPFITISFFDGTNTTNQSFTATGEIIDGWQRISSEFLIPLGTESVTVELGATAGTANFDDLRIYPSDGTFKSFVYDPVTLRLMAELDENNYATFYEYDEEGALIRIKKETERGVMTIQENRNYKVKKP